MFRVLLSWDVAPGMEAEHAVRLRAMAVDWNRRPGFRRLDMWQNAGPGSPQVVALEEWDDAASWSTWAYASEEGSRDLALEAGVGAEDQDFGIALHDSPGASLSGQAPGPVRGHQVQGGLASVRLRARQRSSPGDSPG